MLVIFSVGKSSRQQQHFPLTVSAKNLVIKLLASFACYWRSLG